eukprot:TRINITY_DN93102_c0_g1_i1.p1 TRINITY_DN93102_c0_g1~~TRINITY_DN93102_c0_g1_i1.p1  ORF type:complete len:998 (-),score=177.32 TRINITY_DN93102_c0_g1_i1:47-3040(-)
MSLLVRSFDGVAIGASEAVLRESRVLRDLQDAEEGGGEEELLLPPLFRASEIEELFRLCSELEFDQSSSSAQRQIWASEAEMARQARIMHCAHYLDCPNVLGVLVADFASALVNAPSSSAAAERLCAPEWALHPTREWPGEAEVVGRRLLASQGRGSFLGTRAQVLTATWVCEKSPLSSLPQELCWAILEQADTLCPQELGSTFLVLRDQSLQRGHEVEAAFAKLEARRDQLLNSPLAISVAVAWALAPASQPLTRSAALTTLRSVCTFPDKDAFLAFLAIVDPKRHAESRQTPNVQAVAFKGLPIVTDKEDEGQVQAVVDAASESMLHPVAEVRAAAVACLGAVAQDAPSVFRFVTRTTGLDVLLGDCDLATRSMEEALESSLQSRDPQVRRAAAESIGVLVDKAGVSVAERIVERLASKHGTLSSSMPEMRVSGVLALQHIMCKVQIPQGWAALTASLRDPVFEVRSAVRLAFLALATMEGCYDLMIPLLKETFEVSNEDGRCMSLEIATAITHMKPFGEASACAGKLVQKALADKVPSVSLHGLRLLCALKGPEDALSPVVSLVQSGDEQHRLEACRALVAISKGYEPKVVAAVAAALLLTRPEGQVVEIASILKTLAGSKQDTAAASAYAKLVKMRSETQCIIIALKGLEAVAPKGHALARMAALAMVRSVEQDVVEAAVSCLHCICHRGDQDAVATLIDLVASNLHQMRPIALKALGVLGLASDDLVLETIRSCLDHGYWPIRAAALRAFGNLAPHGCPAAIAAVQARLSDSSADVSADVRQIAVEVLVSIAHPREREVFEFLAAVREEQPLQVQVSIDESLDELLIAGAHSMEDVRISGASESSGARASSSAWMPLRAGYRSNFDSTEGDEKVMVADYGPHALDPETRPSEHDAPMEPSFEIMEEKQATIPVAAAALPELDCREAEEAAAETAPKKMQHLSPVSCSASAASAASTAASTPKSRPELRASLRAFLVKAERTGPTQALKSGND